MGERSVEVVEHRKHALDASRAWLVAKPLLCSRIIRFRQLSNSA